MHEIFIVRALTALTGWFGFHFRYSPRYDLSIGAENRRENKISRSLNIWKANASRELSANMQITIVQKLWLLARLHCLLQEARYSFVPCFASHGKLGGISSMGIIAREISSRKLQGIISARKYFNNEFTQINFTRVLYMSSVLSESEENLHLLTWVVSAKEIIWSVYPSVIDVIPWMETIKVGRCI